MSSTIVIAVIINARVCHLVSSSCKTVFIIVHEQGNVSSVGIGYLNTNKVPKN